MGIDKGEKIKYYEDLFNHTINSFMESPDRWIDFLNLSSKMYRHNFMNQVLIFAQRPEITAIAEYDFWNAKMSRYIKRGSKGIALFDHSCNNLKIKYLFDVSDTGKRKQSKNVYLWSLKELDENGLINVVNKLSKVYGIPDISFSNKDNQIALKEIVSFASSLLAENQWEGNNSISECGLTKEKYIDIVTKNVLYIVCRRCNIDTVEYENEIISDFAQFINNLQRVNIIGISIKQIAYDLL